MNFTIMTIERDPTRAMEMYEDIVATKYEGTSNKAMELTDRLVAESNMPHFILDAAGKEVYRNNPWLKS